MAEGADGAIATLTVDGVNTSLTTITGSHDDSSGTFEGTPYGGGEKVTGSFTC